MDIFGDYFRIFTNIPIKRHSVWGWVFIVNSAMIHLCVSILWRNPQKNGKLIRLCDDNSIQLSGCECECGWKWIICGYCRHWICLVFRRSSSSFPSNNKIIKLQYKSKYYPQTPRTGHVIALVWFPEAEERALFTQQVLKRADKLTKVEFYWQLQEGDWWVVLYLVF